MQILFYILMILSSILGLVVGSSGFVLGLVVEVDENWIWGWTVMLGSLLYLAHPALLYWLYINVHKILALSIATLFIVSSTVLVFLL